jgi:hydrogenase maturation protease
VNGGDALVAGTGNVFLGDDGFGVAVVERLAAAPLPPGVVVRDYGVRGMHLAYDLLAPFGLLLIVDAVRRGEAPGTLFLIEPALAGDGAASAEAHGMDLAAVRARLRALGGTWPRTLIVGCEPADVGEGMGLSPQVAAAVEPAVELVRTVVQRERAGAASTPPRRGTDETQTSSESD